MSYTEQDVREGRRLMDDLRGNKLALGDKLLGISDDPAFEAFCREIGLSQRSARDYCHVARMCTAALRRLIADSGIHVSYSALRVGARTGPGGGPYDEGYSTLRGLLKEARDSGAARVSVTHYETVLGAGPTLRDLVNPPAGSEVTAAEFFSSLQNHPQREDILRKIVTDSDQMRDTVRREIENERRRDRDRRDGEMGCGTAKTDKGFALARDLVRLSDQAVACMNRYPRPPALSDDQRKACVQSLGTFETLSVWVRHHTGAESTAVPRPRADSRKPVTV